MRCFCGPSLTSVVLQPLNPQDNLNLLQVLNSKELFYNLDENENVHWMNRDSIEKWFSTPSTRNDESLFPGATGIPSIHWGERPTCLYACSRARCYMKKQEPHLRSTNCLPSRECQPSPQGQSQANRETLPGPFSYPSFLSVSWALSTTSERLCWSHFTALITSTYRRRHCSLFLFTQDFPLQPEINCSTQDISQSQGPTYPARCFLAPWTSLSKPPRWVLGNSSPQDTFLLSYHLLSPLPRLPGR